MENNPVTTVHSLWILLMWEALSELELGHFRWSAKFLGNDLQKYILTINISDEIQ